MNENKTVELKEEELEQVSGGSKAGDAKFDNVTKILVKWRDTLWNIIPKDSVFSLVDAAAEKEFNGGRYTAIEEALKLLNYYNNYYFEKLTGTVRDQLKNDLLYCLKESEN